MDYYYSLNNQPAGPVSLEQLHQLYRSGVITLETLVVPVGGTEWKPYRTLPTGQDTGGSAVPADAPTEDSPIAGPSLSSTPPPPPPVSPAATVATDRPQPGYKNLVLISWVLLGVTALLAVIPLVGCLTWVMFIPVFITTVVLGVLTMQRGGTTEGILILIASVVVLPIFTLVAPILTTALLGAVTGAGENEKISPAPTVADASPAPRARRTTPSSDTAMGNAPTPALAKQMVNTTMTRFKDAVNSGSFAAFYRTELSNVWKSQTTADQLRTSFESFIDRKIDLTPIFTVQPVLDEPPYVDGNGLLTLVGHYPVESEDVKVTFDLSYSNETKWMLSGIKVNIVRLDE